MAQPTPRRRLARTVKPPLSIREGAAATRRPIRGAPSTAPEQAGVAPADAVRVERFAYSACPGTAGTIIPPFGTTSCATGPPAGSTTASAASLPVLRAAVPPSEISTAPKRVTGIVRPALEEIRTVRANALAILRVEALIAPSPAPPSASLTIVLSLTKACLAGTGRASTAFRPS